jgi:hypothetical protein
VSAPKERPILMNREMVRAVLADRKTVTRRLVKLPGDVEFDGHHESTVSASRQSEPTGSRKIMSPFGIAGDRLWVRESYAPRYFDNGGHAYMADWTGESAECLPEPRWTPSIHMPRAAARLLLDVTSVRVERLLDITEEDAKAEGVAPFFGRFPCFGRDQTITSGELAADAEHRASFAVLWDELYGDSGATWKSNPWVWRVEFRRASAALAGQS